MTNYAALLCDHLTLRVRSLDRIFLQAYVPKLQSVGHICIFLRWQRCRIHRGAAGTGPPRGNTNAKKHGRYSA